jgi:hypothetical protein
VWRLGSHAVQTKPVEDAIGYGRIADPFMPAGTGNCDVRISEPA